MQTLLGILSGAVRKARRSLAIVLLDFRWTRRKLAFFGLQSLEADFALLCPSIEAIRKAGNGAARSACSFVDDTDVSRGLRLVSASLQLAWENVQKNPRELSFQLYGRLFVWRSDVVAV
jgi:hypothetical protein